MKAKFVYGKYRDYRKIDLFVCGDGKNKECEYHGTTTWSRTCKEARRHFAKATGTPIAKVRAYFQKR